MFLSSAASVYTVVGGNGQTTMVATAYSSTIQILASDLAGNPVSGKAVQVLNVQFGKKQQGTYPTATFLNGSASGLGTTNSSGIATIPIPTANNLAGPVQFAINGSLTYVVNFTNLPGAASTLTANSGSGQTAGILSPFAGSMVAQVKDSFGNGVPGAAVTFSPPSTGASITFAGAATSTTDSTGLATSAILTANSVLGGPYTVSASVPGVVAPVTYSLTNGVGSGVAVTVSAGSSPKTTVTI